MRTTLTLERDVAERIARETRRTGNSLKAVVNDALRLGLSPGGKLPKVDHFVVEPHACGIRITTHRQVLLQPLTAGAACSRVRGWLDRPYVGVLHPGDRHAGVLQAELHSTDADFQRFPGLRWANPIG